MKEGRRPQLQQDVAHYLPLADLGHDSEPLRDTAQPALFLQEPLSEGVVGQDESLARGEVVLQLDPIQHLAGRFLGEGQEQDPLGRHPLLAEPPVPLDQHPGLPGARAGDDQEWSDGVGDRRPLGGGEGGGPVAHRDGPDWRKRISRTAGAPMRSLIRSINMPRSRWSWCASAGLLALTHKVPPVSLSAAVSRARGSPTSCGQSQSACASRDRKSTRLNSSHGAISYAVLC